MDLSRKLSPYVEHGVIFNEEHNDERIADCIFCNKQNHFYANNSSGAFSCKRCGSEGTYFLFLNLVYGQYLSNTNEHNLQLLSLDKNIPIEALQYFGVAYDAERVRYIYPYFDLEGKITDLRHYRIGSSKPAVSTEGCSLGLFGLQHISSANNSESGRVIKLCAGESDTIIYSWLVNRLGIREIVLGVPGETTFKKEWTDTFRLSDTHVCYDNDTAGDDGHDKVDKYLTGVSESIQFINWPEALPKGYDLRDYITSSLAVSNAWNESDKLRACYNNIQRLIKPYHRRATKERKATATVSKTLKRPEGPRPTLDAVLTGFSSFMQLNSNLEDAIKLSLATVASNIYNPMPDPNWLFLVGPPGCGKTTILMSFKESKKCYFQSTLRARSLISGFTQLGGYDPSILARIDNKCLVLKDFTEVLGKPPHERSEIFSILRGAYDGEAELDFGNGQTRKYNCRFSFLAGTTKEIYTFSTTNLGERFIKYNIIGCGGSEADRITDTAMESAIEASPAKSAICGLVNHFLYDPFDKPPNLPHEMRERLKPLSRLVGALRTTVSRHERGVLQGHPVYQPEREGGQRVAVQLQRVLLSLQAIGVGLDDAYRIVKQICRDSIHSFSSSVVGALAKANPGMTKARIAEETNQQVFAVDKYLDDLLLLGIVYKKSSSVKSGGAPGVTYVENVYDITKEIRELWLQSQINHL